MQSMYLEKSIYKSSYAHIRHKCRFTVFQRAGATGGHGLNVTLALFFSEFSIFTELVNYWMGLIQKTLLPWQTE